VTVRVSKSSWGVVKCVVTRFWSPGASWRGGCDTAAATTMVGDVSHRGWNVVVRDLEGVARASARMALEWLRFVARNGSIERPRMVLDGRSGCRFASDASSPGGGFGVGSGGGLRRAGATGESGAEN
jgi:hypothetical protein